MLEKKVTCGDAITGEMVIMDERFDAGLENEERQRIDELIEKFLANNPGNFVRQKAVSVDLSELELVRRQLL